MPYRDASIIKGVLEVSLGATEQRLVDFKSDLSEGAGAGVLGVAECELETIDTSNEFREIRYGCAKACKMLRVAFQLLMCDGGHYLRHATVPCRTHCVANTELDGAVTPMSHGAKFACEGIVCSHNHAPFASLDRLL